MLDFAATSTSEAEADALGEVKILGCRVHSVTMAQTVVAAKLFIESPQPHYIVTADSSAIVLAQDDSELRQLINSADLVTPDGTGVLIAAKLRGTPLPERVSGVDICHSLCELAARDGYTIFLLGAAPGVAEEAGEKLQAKFPGLKVAGTHHGYFKPEEETDIVSMVAASGARVLFVAMGIPRQEKFIRRHLDKLNVGVAMGVGGSLDVLSGRIQRAPVWMQKHGLEWFYRLCKDPSKISKVALLPRFFAMALKEKWFGGRIYE